MKEKKKNRRNK